jgi:small subunit ribosomal protein S20
MPNTKSAIKRARSTAQRAARNRSVKSRLKTLERRFLDTLDKGGLPEAQAALNDTVSALAKAAKGGVIPSEMANRKRSRLHLKLNAKQAAPAA